MVERPFPAYQGPEPYVFVCYSHEDRAEVYPELIQLREAGFNVWYDEGICPGTEWSEALAQAIGQCGVFLFYVTSKSVVSVHCRAEVNFALEQRCALLAVHLAPTDLPSGLKLSLSHRQAILRYEHSARAYRQKLLAAIERAAVGRSDTEEDSGTQRWRIGDWILDPGTQRLTRGADSRALNPKEQGVLAHLAEAAPELVSSDDLLERTWPNVVVGDHVLHEVVGRLRKGLGDNARNPTYIETLPKRGYRLLVPVVPVPPEIASSDRSGRPVWYAAMGIGFLVALLAAGWFGLPSQNPPTDDLPYHDGFADIAIEPFRNLSGDPQIGQLAASLASDLGYELDKASRIRIVEQSHPDSTTKPYPADYLLRADLSPMGGDLRVLIRLVRRSDGQIVWHDTDLGPLADAEATLPARVKRIAAMIDAMQTIDYLSQFLATDDAVAKRHYIAAHKEATRQHLGSEMNWAPIVRDYERAIQRDPQFVQPYWMLANAYTLRLGTTIPVNEALFRARDMMEQALRLAPDDPTTIVLLGDIQKDLELDYAGALKTYDRALEAGAFAPLIDYHLGTIFLRLGRFEDANDRFDAALGAGVGINRVAALLYKGQALTLLGDEDAALKALDEALESSSGGGTVSQLVLREKAEVLGRMDEVEQANRALDQAWDLGGKRKPESFPSVFAQLGRTQEARRILERMEARSGGGETVLAWQAFEAYYYLGEYRQALSWLMRAIEDRQAWLFPRLRSGRYPAIRNDTRFQAAMARLKEIELPPWDLETDS